MEEDRASGGEETPRRNRFRSTSPVITEGVKPQPVLTRASNPVGVKVKRLQSKIGKDRSHINKTIGQQTQPTLRSFLDPRGGLVSPKSRATITGTSKDGSKAETGQGPQLDPKTRDSGGFGVIGRRKTYIGGSPEHQLMKEAGNLKPGGHYLPGKQGDMDKTKALPEGRGDK